MLCHIINTYQLRAYIYASSDLKFSAGSMENNNFENLDELEETESKPCYCQIKDWRAKETILFVSLVKKGEQADYDKKRKP